MAQQSTPPRPRRLRHGSIAQRRFVRRLVIGCCSWSRCCAGARTQAWRAPAKAGMPQPPTKGGTLKLLGTSDIFNLDTVSAYYTVSSLLERAFTRQLVSYPNAADVPRLDQDRAGHRDGRARRRATASAPTARPTRSSCARA